MRRWIFAAACLGVVASAAPLGAQGGISFGLGGGLSLPEGDLADGVNTGWHGLATAELASPLHPWGLRLDVAYNRFSFSDEAEVALAVRGTRPPALRRWESSIACPRSPRRSRSTSWEDWGRIAPSALWAPAARAEFGTGGTMVWEPSSSSWDWRTSSRFAGTGPRARVLMSTISRSRLESCFETRRRSAEEPINTYPVTKDGELRLSLG